MKITNRCLSFGQGKRKGSCYLAFSSAADQKKTYGSFLNSKNLPQPNNYLDEHLVGRNPIFVPTLLLYELVNAPWYSKRLDRKDIEQAIEILNSFQFAYVSPDISLLNDALSVGEKAKLSIYDASYVALAQRLACPFVTADAKLHHKTKSPTDIVLPDL